MKKYYFPELVVSKINTFLGLGYWKDRKQLTILSEAMDFAFSDYFLSSYWLWNDWRKRNPLINYDFIPKFNPRFRGIENNEFISKISPPELTISHYEIERRHKELRARVFFE